MPHHPKLGTLADDLSAAVFSSLVPRLQAFDGESFPLHVGDTWLDPTESARMASLTIAEHPDLHRYVAPHGYGPLRDALLEHERSTKRNSLEGHQLLVTAGATAGLHCSLSVMLEPGDEVLVLAPHWPLIVGIVRACRGVPKPVDILPHLQTTAPDTDGIINALERSLSSRTAAIYLSSPSNPTGKVLPAATIKAVVEWAAKNDLWVISDEVYEHYAFDIEHTDAAQFDPERTLTAYSFSKSYGLAGGRCGYITGPKHLIHEATKIGTHTFYSTPTMAQAAALHALRDGNAWLRNARAEYQAIGAEAAAMLGVPEPEGGTFLFLDLTEVIRSRDRKVSAGKTISPTPGETSGLIGLLEDCADRGLLLAPGPSFGPYPTMARFCFTCVEPEKTRKGAQLLRQILDEHQS